MRKSIATQVVTTINVNLKRSAKSDLATFRSVVFDLKKDPVKLRDVAIRAGNEHLAPGENNYDWLGHGTYFWEYSLQRAFQFAQEKFKREGRILLVS